MMSRAGFEWWNVQFPNPDRIRFGSVPACGICHTDAATITGIYPGLTSAAPTGHEVVGRIDALGAGVSGRKIGQRVGVGSTAGEDWCLRTMQTRRHCELSESGGSGVTVDGGYAEVTSLKHAPSLLFRMSSHLQSRPLSSVRESRPTTLSATPAYAAEI